MDGQDGMENQAFIPRTDFSFVDAEFLHGAFRTIRTHERCQRENDVE